LDKHGSLGVQEEWGFQIAKFIEKHKRKTLSHEITREESLASHDFQMPKLQYIFWSDNPAHPALDTKGISLKVETYRLPQQVVESQNIWPLTPDMRLVVGLEEGGRSGVNCLASSLKFADLIAIVTADCYYFDDSRL
jgi:hypothetical protein